MGKVQLIIATAQTWGLAVIGFSNKILPPLQVLAVVGSVIVTGITIYKFFKQDK